MNLLQAGSTMVIGASIFAVGMAFGQQTAAHKRISDPASPPRPGAPYTPGVMAGDLLYLSGNIGTDPTSGKAPEAFGDAAKQALANLGGVIKAAGLGWEDVVKVNVYVEDIAKYDEFNKLYTDLPGGGRPAGRRADRDRSSGGAEEVERGGEQASFRRDTLDKVASRSYLFDMKVVGLKVLKNRLAEYVRLAASGETVLVTDRDRVVAELVPPAAGRSPWLADALLAEAVREGYVIAPLMVAEGPPPRMPIAPLKQLLGELDQDRQDR
jgi:2-iminobutanoate/2-iminopropanoate deaminase